MNQKALAVFAVFTLLFGAYSGVAFADDKADTKKDARQVPAKPSPANSDQKNCANDLESLKKLLSDASAKASALKEKLYSEWQSQSSSGQTKDDWSAYAKKLESSQEMQDLRNLQEKYNMISSTCQSSTATAYESKVQFTQSSECVNAQKMVDDIDQKYSTLKQNAYDNWKSQNAAGTYTGTWEQFANEFIHSSQVTELNQARQKYEPILRTCYVQTSVPVQPSTTPQRQLCPDADIQSVQTMLNDASQRIGTLKDKVYTEWKASYDSGQTKDDWNAYSKKNLEGSQEFVNYQQLQQKLDLLYKMCKTNEKPQAADSKPVNPEPRVQFTQSAECVSAKNTLDSIDQKYSLLKQNAYDNWKSQNAAGTYTGTWEQYADEKLIKSTDVLDLAKMREKYEPFLRTCYTQYNGMAPTDASQAKPLQITPSKTEKSTIVATKSTTKPLPATSEKTSPVTTDSKTKPLSTVPKTDQTQYAKTDAAAKKQYQTSTKLTKAKPEQIIKKAKKTTVPKTSSTKS